MSLSYKSQLAPKGLEFKSAEMVISDKYSTVLTIVSYPKFISEGYLYSSGSLMAFTFWLLIGATYPNNYNKVNCEN